jgi:hypothetical protein
MRMFRSRRLPLLTVSGQGCRRGPLYEICQDRAPRTEFRVARHTRYQGSSEVRRQGRCEPASMSRATLAVSIKPSSGAVKFGQLSPSRLLCDIIASYSASVVGKYEILSFQMSGSHLIGVLSPMPRGSMPIRSKWVMRFWVK